MPNLIIPKETFESVFVQTKEALERDSSCFTKDLEVPDFFDEKILAQNMCTVASDLSDVINGPDSAFKYKVIDDLLIEFFDKAIKYRTYFKQLRINGTI